MRPEPVLRRHADHDPSLICRPALGYGLCEVPERAAGLDVTELVRPGERARALQVPKPPPVPDGQASLFDEAG